MKTIVVTVFHAFIARNVLYGGFIDTLKKSGARVVLLVPDKKYEYFRSLFDESVTIEPVNIEALIRHRENALLSRIAFQLQRSYLSYRRDAATSGVRSLVKSAFETVFLALFADKAFSRVWLRRRFLGRAYTEPIGSLLEKYRPDLVFVTDLFNLPDQLTLVEARRRRLRDIAMIRSWDNCFSKGILPIVPTRTLCNTNELKKEAAESHDVPSETVEVIGLPQMDVFFNTKPLERAAFMRKIGAGPEKKLILFAPGGTVLTDIDWQLCQIFDEAIKSGAIPHPTHLLVRNHPNHPADLRKFSGSTHITVEYPGKRFDENDKSTELTQDDQFHLRDSLANADIVVWVATTLGVDASVFDKPEIAINFDGYETRPFVRSVRKYMNEPHMKKMLSTNGAKLVSNKDELVQWINTYLEDPSVDADGRERIRQMQLVFTDGKSTERLASAVVRAL